MIENLRTTVKEQGAQVESSANEIAKLSSQVEASKEELANKDADINRARSEADRVKSEMSRLLGEMQAKLAAAEKQQADALAEAEVLRQENTELKRSVEAAPEAPAETAPRQRRTRLIETPVELKPTLEASSTGTGVFNKEIAEGANIDGKVESRGEKVSESQIEELRQEIARLKKSETEAERARARNLETVIRILESTGSSEVRDKAHDYIARHIKEGEAAGRNGLSEGSVRGSLSRGVALGIVVSAALAYYASQQEAVAGESRYEDEKRATVSPR